MPFLARVRLFWTNAVICALIILASSSISFAQNSSKTLEQDVLASSDSLLLMDIDGNGEADALTDGLLLLRGMFGLTEDALITGVLAPNASCISAYEIESRIAELGNLADIDGNGKIDALTDGLLTLRYLFGLEGDALINGVVESDAARPSAEQIEAHLKTLMPALDDGVSDSERPTFHGLTFSTSKIDNSGGMYSNTSLSVKLRIKDDSGVACHPGGDCMAYLAPTTTSSNRVTSITKMVRECGDDDKDGVWRASFIIQEGQGTDEYYFGTSEFVDSNGLSASCSSNYEDISHYESCGTHALVTIAPNSDPTGMSP